MPADKTVDFVVMFVVVGMLAAGLASISATKSGGRMG